MMSHNLGTSMDKGRKEWVAWMKSRNPATAFELGVGFGYVGMEMKRQMPDLRLSGCDIFPPAVEKHCTDPSSPYVEVILGDMLDVLKVIDPIDLLVISDCLEHVTKAQAGEVMGLATSVAPCIALRIPVGEYPQKANRGNVHEAHLWSFYPSMFSELPAWEVVHANIIPTKFGIKDWRSLPVHTDLLDYDEYRLPRQYIGSFGLVRRE